MQILNESDCMFVYLCAKQTKQNLPGAMRFMNEFEDISVDATSREIFAAVFAI